MFDLLMVRCRSCSPSKTRSRHSPLHFPLVSLDGIFFMLDLLLYLSPPPRFDGRLFGAGDTRRRRTDQIGGQLHSLKQLRSRVLHMAAPPSSSTQRTHSNAHTSSQRISSGMS
jgi:hypothetical protein